LAPLTDGGDGNFYGVAALGGIHGLGTVFKISAAGEFQVLYSFGSQPGNADGVFPYGGLTKGPDGNFYGTTMAGGLDVGQQFMLYGAGVWCNGPRGHGTVFRVTPAGY